MNMLVKGNQTTTTQVTVEINPRTVVEQLFDDFKSEMPGEYINQDGKWETWDDLGGRGSGLTDTFRDATPEEQQTYNAFKGVLLYMRTLS